MLCPKCGKKVNDDDLFCTFCGTRLKITKSSKRLETDEAVNDNPLKKEA